MNVLTKSLLLFFILLFTVTLSFSQTFPPTKVTGPFPTGQEPVRSDSPVDVTRPGDILHEYTCYRVSEPPVIDGEIDNDPVWNRIPWTVMTWWENSNYVEEFSIFDGVTNDHWTEWEDCTAWWKFLWDGDLLYLAIKVYDTDYNPPLSPSDPGSMHQQDCIQFGLHTTPPDVPAADASDLGCELGFGITNADGDFVELFANWNWSGHPWANAQMQLAEGDNASGNASTDGKAIHASVEDTGDYFIYRFELALTLDDAQYDWYGFIGNDYIGRVSAMAMDHDTGDYEDVNWGSGILTKDFARLASVLFSADPPPATTEEGLMAHWTFDEGSGTTASDASGNGNNGTITGAAWINGKVGSGALAFNGTDNWVQVPHSTSLAITDQITISAWVHANDTTGSQNALQKEFYAIGEVRNGGFANVLNIGNTWIVKSYSGRASAYVGKWHHIAMTYDGAKFVNYMDGQVDGSFDQTGTIGSSTAVLGIGKNSPWNDAWFDGYIDDVRIYNKALSAAEIEAMYAAVAVEERVVHTQPNAFELAQNYPNPFNPTTTISYALPQATVVTLKVYNLRGEEVATLVNHEAKSAGKQQVQFDASDLNSGIYVYQLRAGLTTLSRKMTVVK